MLTAVIPVSGQRRAMGDDMRQCEIRQRLFGLTAAVCAATTLLGGCQRPAQSSAPAAPGPNVWATVDGRDILRDDVEKAYRNNLDPSAPAPSDEEAVNLKLNILDELITQDLLQARAARGRPRAERRRG